MKTVKIFIFGAVISAFCVVAGIYMSFGVLGFIALLLIPLAISSWISEKIEPKCALMILLSYSVMLSPWEFSSLVLVALIMLCALVGKPLYGQSYMAAWLLGMEAASVGMEYYATKSYHMDNLWHDIAILVFVIYALIYDINLEKKGCA